jgi:hypothetical protein
MVIVPVFSVQCCGYLPFISSRKLNYPSRVSQNILPVANPIWQIVRVEQPVYYRKDIAGNNEKQNVLLGSCQPMICPKRRSLNTSVSPHISAV